jgi:hypothetical protein
MTQPLKAPNGCINPAHGRHLEDYLSGEASDNIRADFEEHFFECPACLSEIQLQQGLDEELSNRPARGEKVAGFPSTARTPRWPSISLRRWVPLAAAAVVILVGGLYLFLPRTVQPEFHLVHLVASERGDEPSAEAPSGQPLELSLALSVRQDEPVTYDVDVSSAGLGSVFHATRIPPVSDTEVRVSIPSGIANAGDYSVKLSEQTLGANPRTHSFTLRVFPR